MWRHNTKEVTKDTAIPLEKAQAELLMIAGEDDHNWESARWLQWLGFCYSFWVVHRFL